jgi:3-oxoacyl-[acyl-carrier-protein] synthase-3
MNYNRVFLEAIGYELAPVVVTSQELEDRLRPVYEALRLPDGQLEALTGIAERRWWEPGYPLHEGAVRAARKALEASNVLPEDVGVLIYAAVCREQFEPATACRVAADLGLKPDTVFDLSNACLGVLNGIVEVANRIELGQVRAGLVVSCETAREINDAMIEELVREGNMDRFRTTLATFTGGSGAAAVLVTDGSFARPPRRRVVGGTTHSAPQHNGLCRWGLEGVWNAARQIMFTDSVAILRYGVELGLRTWKAFLARLGWMPSSIDKVICHQVGSSHRDSILRALGIPADKDYSTYSYLGNMGTVSLPLTAALAEERAFLRPGDRVGLLGIGSGLNCLMLGVEW